MDDYKGQCGVGMGWMTIKGRCVMVMWVDNYERLVWGGNGGG